MNASSRKEGGYSAFLNGSQGVVAAQRHRSSHCHCSAAAHSGVFPVPTQGSDESRNAIAGANHSLRLCVALAKASKGCSAGVLYNGVFLVGGHGSNEVRWSTVMQERRFLTLSSKQSGQCRCCTAYNLRIIGVGNQGRMNGPHAAAYLYLSLQPL